MSHPKARRARRFALALGLALATGCSRAPEAPAASATAAIGSLAPAATVAARPTASSEAEVAALADLAPETLATAGLAAELGLDARETLLVEHATKRAFEEAVAEIARRDPHAAEPDEEAIHAVLASHQKALDLENAAQLTPEKRARFLAIARR